MPVGRILACAFLVLVTSVTGCKRDLGECNLDGETGATVLTLLQRLARAGGHALLVATHSREALAIADRVLRFADGRLVEGDVDPP